MRNSEAMFAYANQAHHLLPHPSSPLHLTHSLQVSGDRGNFALLSTNFWPTFFVARHNTVVVNPVQRISCLLPNLLKPALSWDRQLQRILANKPQNEDFMTTRVT